MKRARSPRIIPDMPITLELPSELERRLRDAAAERGVDESELATQALVSHLSALYQEPLTANLEASLLQEVGKGFPASWWERYSDLVARREGGELTAGEHRELIQLTDELEALGADRLNALAKLAKLRGVSVQSLMDELEITPHPASFS